MKYNIFFPYGVAGEICKYLSFNDIVEALTAKLFENNIDVIHHKRVTKSRLLAKMAVNSSFNYTKNKILTTRQILTLILEHSKILLRHLARCRRTELFRKLNDEMKPVEGLIITADYYGRGPLNDIETTLTSWLMNKYEHRYIYISIVQHRFPKCPIESILADNNKHPNKRKHTDIRDLKSFISPKQVKLLKLIN